MYDGPVREGNRGGQGDFRWSAVSDDKHRENYLGHSVNAPVGRWQKNKDIHWYTRDVESSDASRADREKKEEIRRLKEAEEDALDLALGLPPKQRDGDGDDERSGANAIPVKGAEAAEKEVKRREKELRREQRALKRAEREVNRDEKDRIKEERRSERRSEPARYGDGSRHRSRYVEEVDGPRRRYDEGMRDNRRQDDGITTETEVENDIRGRARGRLGSNESTFRNPLRGGNAERARHLGHHLVESGKVHVQAIKTKRATARITRTPSEDKQESVTSS
ncbi:MAG: hypothetical protein TREMPRED_003244 [Tremellales sp. Tagirdzhanova-0007]|nr:MAG: hypothetical protein TREMPRED_003244 [Tremellales sp. Tagirdzhanova-0007]